MTRTSAWKLNCRSSALGARFALDKIPTYRFALLIDKDPTMTRKEALEWLTGERSHRYETSSDLADLPGYRAKMAQADAASAQQAYWILKAHSEGLILDAVGRGSEGEADSNPITQDTPQDWEERRRLTHERTLP